MNHMVNHILEASFKSIGKGVTISPLVQFYNPETIEIGDNVRIDNFCILSGGSGLKIGSHVHIACYASMFAGSGIVISDFCQIASYSMLISETDDFSGRSLIGTQVPREFKPGYVGKKIVLERHVTLGARCTILPGVTMREGSIAGAHSLVNKDCDAWSLYCGSPAKKVKERVKSMLELEAAFLKQRSHLQKRIDACYDYERYGK